MKSTFNMLLVIGGLSLAQFAHSTVTFTSSFEFSGGTAPGGTPPWLRASIEDAGVDTVKIKLENLNLIGSEFVSKSFLNFRPTLNAAGLIFSAPTKVGTFSSPTISLGQDLFKADGDGYFDILFEFGTSAPSRFGAGESVSFLVSGIVGLDESDFNFISVNGPAGKTGFPVASHVQGIGNGLSGWVTTPEPGTMLALGAGVVALARKRRAKS